MTPPPLQFDDHDHYGLCTTKPDRPCVATASRPAKILSARRRWPSLIEFPRRELS
jgi:hypothetical protein